jgi:hypothetical protein
VASGGYGWPHSEGRSDVRMAGQKFSQGAAIAFRWQQACARGRVHVTLAPRGKRGESVAAFHPFPYSSRENAGQMLLRFILVLTLVFFNFEYWGCSS